VVIMETEELTRLVDEIYKVNERFSRSIDRSVPIPASPPRSAVPSRQIRISKDTARSPRIPILFGGIEEDQLRN